MGMMKEIEQRAQSLSHMLATPVSEDDYVEKGRRAVLQKFVVHCVGIISLLIPLSGSLRWSLQGLNHLLNNVHSLGSSKVLTLP